MINGYDISSLQGNVDFRQLYNNGIRFCIFRCGVGNDFIDTNCAKNLAAAKAVGMKVAIYHFIYPLPTDPNHPMRDPVGQAEYHFKAGGQEIAFCDIEWPLPKDWKTWGCSAQQIQDWCIAYINHYEQLSGNPIGGIYSYPDFCSNVKFADSFAKFPLWLANYSANPITPSPWKDFVICQTGIGKLPNGTPVDLDVMADLSLVWDDNITVMPVMTPEVNPVVLAPAIIIPPVVIPPPAPTQ